MEFQLHATPLHEELRALETIFVARATNYLTHVSSGGVLSVTSRHRFQLYCAQ